MDSKSDFLGENASTAAHKLRRSILFLLVQQTNRDVCFRCGKKIRTVVDFSIDHKKPWLYVSKKLFWDLKNIAFSHKKCNTTDRPWLRETIENPKGKNWCNGCKKFKSIKSFSKNKNVRDGLDVQCKDCKHKRRCPAGLGG
jgi:hypothetical protein